MQGSGFLNALSPSPFQGSQPFGTEPMDQGTVEVWSRSSHGLMCTNLVTETGRRRVAQLILLITLIPMVAMVIQNAIIVGTSRVSLQKNQVVQSQVLLNIQIGDVVHYAQLERGSSALFLSSKKSGEFLAQLFSFRGKLDSAITQVSDWDWTLPVDSDDTTGVDFLSRRAFSLGIVNFRSLVDATNMSVETVLQFYSSINGKLIEWMVSGLLKSSSQYMWARLVAYHMLIVAKEQAGVERAYGSTFFVEEQSVPDNASANAVYSRASEDPVILDRDNGQRDGCFRQDRNPRM